MEPSLGGPLLDLFQSLPLSQTNRVNQQFSLYDTRSSPTRQPVMFGDGESGSGAGTDGSSKGRSKYVRGSWQKNLFASADQRGNLRVRLARPKTAIAHA